MKTLFIIYLITSILTFIFMILLSLDVITRIRKENPTFHRSESNTLTKIISWIRVILISFCPLINLILLIFLIFKWEDFVNTTKNKVLNE